MKRFNLLVAAITLSLVQVAQISSASADTIDGLVVGVMDGDTIDVLDRSNSKHRIRLAGIDAPEKAQAFGTRSKQALSELVYKKQVRVTYSTKDMYGRVIGQVVVDEVDANRNMVEQGLAWVYRTCNRQDVCTPSKEGRPYVEAETYAVTTKAGLWVDPSPMAPWEFRRNVKSGKLPETQDQKRQATSQKDYSKEGMTLNEIGDEAAKSIKNIYR